MVVDLLTKIVKADRQGLQCAEHQCVMAEFSALADAKLSLEIFGHFLDTGVRALVVLARRRGYPF
jgi:hypothetical protein